MGVKGKKKPPRQLDSVMQIWNLQPCCLRLGNLCGADLSGALLRHANLEGADLAHANLRSANLFDTRLGTYGLTMYQSKPCIFRDMEFLAGILFFRNSLSPNQCAERTVYRKRRH